MAEQIKIPVDHNWVGETWDWPLQHNDGVVKVNNTKDKFEVGLDVQFFTPNEIEVRCCSDEIIRSKTLLRETLAITNRR